MSNGSTPPGENDGGLGAGLNDANQNFGSTPVGSGVHACAVKSWIEIKLVDQDGNPVPGEGYQVELPDGSTVKGILDTNGFARIDQIDPGTCDVSFPGRDAKDWKRN
jgi:hypothetical protein